MSDEPDAWDRMSDKQQAAEEARARADECEMCAGLGATCDDEQSWMSYATCTACNGTGSQRHASVLAFNRLWTGEYSVQVYHNYVSVHESYEGRQVYSIGPDGDYATLENLTAALLQGRSEDHE